MAKGTTVMEPPDLLAVDRQRVEREALERKAAEAARSARMKVRAAAQAAQDAARLDSEISEAEACALAFQKAADVLNGLSREAVARCGAPALARTTAVSTADGIVSITRGVAASTERLQRLREERRAIKV